MGDAIVQSCIVTVNLGFYCNKGGVWVAGSVRVLLLNMGLWGVVGG